MKLIYSKNKVLSNTLWSLLGKIIAMLFLMIFDAIIARSLSIEGYAEWVFFFAILTMMFYIGWLGINTSLKVFISKCNSVQDRDNCIKGALVLRLIVSLLIALLIYLLVPQFAGILGYPDKYSELKALLKFSSILVFFNSFTEFYKEMCIGLQKYKSLFLITVFEYGGYLTFSVIVLYIWNNVKAVALGYCFSGICIFILGIWIIKRKVGFCVENTSKDFIKYIKPIMKYAIPIAVISFGGLILIEMDTFMIGLLSTKSEVATYSIAKNLCSKATHINYALTVGTMTTFSVITNENVIEKYKQFQKVSGINLFVTCSISLVFFLLSDFVINILYGYEYVEATRIMHMLIPYYMLYSISNFYSSFLDFRGKAKFRSICYVSIIIINLILNFSLIPLWGAMGAAIATDLSLVPYTIIVIWGTYKHFYILLDSKKFSIKNNSYT